MRPLSALLALSVGLSAQSPAAPTPFKVLALQGETAHVQGIDTDGASLWVTSVDRAQRKGYLQQYSVQDGHLLKSLEIQDGDRYHPGGIATDANSVWIPLAEYRAKSTAVIQQRNKRTFALEFQFAVPDHIGCVAVTETLIIGGNWDSRDFYIWDRQGKLISKIPSSTGNAYQDLKVHDGVLVASGSLSAHQGAVDWLDPVSMTLVRRLLMGNTNRGNSFTREGMTIFGNQLLLLPEDGASRLFVFELPGTTVAH
ncbi:MAG: DUF6454 family protein [Bryobacteraceae bacterium]